MKKYVNLIKLRELLKRRNQMTDSEKKHNILVARNLIQNVLKDTDEDTWAAIDLTEALIELDRWLEESYI